ncbi:hypothetical protein BX616_008424, partial [Lobosporangium transversale]
VIEGIPVQEETITTTTETVTGEIKVVQTDKAEVITHEDKKIIKAVATVTHVGEVPQPAISKETSWFRRAAGGALEKVDGVWKRSVQVLTTRKAKVDEVAPIAKTSYVYFDDVEVYDSILVDKNSRLTHHIQLIFDSESSSYYVYNRWGEKDYKLDGPHKTIEDAKASFYLIYKEWFGLEWSQRQISTSERYTVETITYETIEETETIEEIINEKEVVVQRTEDVGTGNDTVIKTETITVITEPQICIEYVEKTPIIVEVDVEGEKEIKTIITKEKKEKGVVTQPAVSKKASWFRRVVKS